MRIYCDMCGDLFHYGHVDFLKQCKFYNDNPDNTLIVGVHNDQTIQTYKRTPIMNTNERMKVIDACRYVDKIIPDSPLKLTNEFIYKNNIDIIITVNNKTDEEIAMMYDSISNNIIKKVPYTESISTTNIIERIKQLSL